jgi:hypothetical protein
VTSGHILTEVQNLIAGHGSFIEEPQGLCPVKCFSVRLLPYRLADGLLRMVIEIRLGLRARSCGAGRFNCSEGLRSWDWKKEENGNVRIGRRPS